MKRLVLAAAVLVPMTWALASGPHAGPGPHKHRGHHAPGQLGHHRPPHPPPPHMIGAEIGLEATQVDALEALAAELHDARRAVHSHARERLLDELTKDAPDFDALEAMAVGEAEAIHAAHLDHIAGMRALAESLDEAQRARLVAHLERLPPPPPPL